MSRFNRGRSREDLRFVAINDLLFYGFKTKDAASIPGVSASDLTALGHQTATAIADNNTKILVFAPRAPKPVKFKKSLSNPAGQQQSFTAFCAYNAKATALAAGFTPVAKSGRKVSLRAAVSGNGSKISAIAEMENGALFVWPMDSTDFGAYSTELGLQSAANITTEAERKVLVAAPGAGMRPGRAVKQLAEGTISSYFSFGANIAASGWSVTAEENLGIDTYTAGGGA